MATTIMGVVTNGVVIPNSPLPEGASVEIQLRAERLEGAPDAAVRSAAGELSNRAPTPFK
jgi:hypothetical protein